MFKLIYRRPAKDPRDKYAPPPVGSLEDIRVGDIVSYYDVHENARAAGVVEKINVAVGVLRLAARTYTMGTYKGTQYRPPRKLTVAEIIKAERQVPDEEITSPPVPDVPVPPPHVIPEEEPQQAVPAVTAPTPAPSTGKQRDARLPAPGTVLEREFKGKTIKVLVQDVTFEYEGRVYKSLSKIAAEITGGSTNGFTFFKL